ncbi:MAG: AsmA family protein, partial [Proteobacteria bacterium]|nr:AsmA family protein [Pseudomonadota bacterium]
LQLQDVSLERPIRLFCKALVDAKPLSLEGTVGPLGKEPGKGAIPLDLTLKALAQLQTSLKGRVVDPLGAVRFELEMQVPSFSPRKLLAAMGQAFPVTTSDPEVLNRLALNAKIAGDTRQVSILEGMLDVDESKMKFIVKAEAFEKPDIMFDVFLDKIDADRYLPVPDKKQPADSDKGQLAEAAKPGSKVSAPDTKADTPDVKAAEPGAKPVDYTPLRRLVLNGTARIGKLKIKNANIEDISLKINAKNGIFNLDPFSLALYQGSAAGNGSLDVQTDIPKVKVDLNAKKIQVNPLLNDVLKKDFLGGALQAKINLALSGDTPEHIKKTLNGAGDLLFTDGYIKGIDLAGMVRNVIATFGLAEKDAQRPQTDFAELHVPFTVRNGLVNTPQTQMVSPLLRVKAAGNADLLRESLDFRIEPKFVATLKGQGDTADRSGFMVPVLVSGSFTSPKFRPDLKGMLTREIEKKLPDLQKSLLGGDNKKENLKQVGEQIKGIFKGLPWGR